MSDTEKTDHSFFNANLVPGVAEKRILTWCKDHFEKARKNRQQFEQIWYMNLAFYFGRQYAQWGPPTAQGTRQLYEPNVPPWRVRLVSNKIRPIVRTELAKVTKEKPQAFVIPATTEDEDLAAARGAEGLFDFLWRTLLLNRQIRRTEFWAIICGSSFIKDWYDPELRDATGLEGSICAEPVSPFHLYIPDTQEEVLDHQPFTIHVLAKNPEWVYDTYQKEVKPDSNGSSGILEQRFLSAIGINSNIHKDMVAVHEMQIKPCRYFPDGAKVTWAGETILDIEDSWAYQHGEYSFTKFDHVPSGKFYADSIIPDLVPLQKEYNRTRSQIIEAKNRMAKPQLIAPRGSIDPNKVTSEPGLIIFYTPGYTPPQPIPLTSLPSYVIEELDRCQRDMDDISSQHEVTKGRTPPGVTAATAISYLQEEDDSKLSHTVTSLEEGVERIGRHLLSHVDQFWDQQRQIQIIGENGQWETLMFGRADIKGNTDLKIEAGSAQPRSRAAKQAFIMEAIEKQLIPPERGLKYLDMAETSKLYEEMQLDSRQAQRENMKMMAGQPVSVNSWDNNEAHLIDHNNKRKTQDFENASLEVKQLFEQHCQAHQQAITLAQTGQPAPPGMPMPGGNQVQSVQQ